MKDNVISEKSMAIAAKDMEKSREKLLLAQKIAGIGSFEYLPEERYIILSDEATDVLGLDPSIKAYSIEDFCKKIRTGRVELFCVDMQKAASGQLKDDIEFIIKCDNKENRYIEVFFEPPSSTVKGSVAGVFHNVTKRKTAELTRGAKAQEFETVLDNARLGIIVINLKGQVIQCNASAVNLLGYSESELKNLHGSVLLFEEDWSEANKIFARFINSAGKLNFMEYRLKHKSGKTVNVFVNFEMIIGPEGEKIYIFINDITERKEMERKNLDQERMLIQQSKMATLGEMVGLIAHQWQQPINSIAMIVQMLEELLDVDEKNAKMLAKSVESVMAQVSFMANTIDNFRHFLKPAYIMEDFNLLRVVNEVLNLYRPQLKHHNIDCDVFPHHDMVRKVEICGYENELKNVLLNFLSNSRDAIVANRNDGSGVVQVELSIEDDKVKLVVDDNGGGVDDELLKRIFEPYVTSKGKEGTGLGLYMAKLIVVDRMKGEILAENGNKGLRITLTFDITHR
jgi:PAS domain S-box-containing protein